MMLLICSILFQVIRSTINANCPSLPRAIGQRNILAVITLCYHKLWPRFCIQLTHFCPIKSHIRKKYVETIGAEYSRVMPTSLIKPSTIYGTFYKLNKNRYGILWHCSSSILVLRNLQKYYGAWHKQYAHWIPLGIQL